MCADTSTRKLQRDGEYKEKGDYHREIDEKWRYYPVYQAKMEYIDDFIRSVPKNAKILDAGCGEGILVEKYRGLGFDIIGLDLNYSSDYIYQGSILDMPFKNNEFDIVLCLDVIEHLPLDDHDASIREVARILKKGGTAVLALPNLAHFFSRISFLLAGKLIRTSSVDRHKGDRPIHEYVELIDTCDLTILKRKGIFPTFPIISALTYYYPQKVSGLHAFYNAVLSYPNWCFLNIIVCKKEG